MTAPPRISPVARTTTFSSNVMVVTRRVLGSRKVSNKSIWSFGRTIRFTDESCPTRKLTARTPGTSRFERFSTCACLATCGSSKCLPTSLGRRAFHPRRWSGDWRERWSRSRIVPVCLGPEAYLSPKRCLQVSRGSPRAQLWVAIQR